MRIFRRAAAVGMILWISLAAACQSNPIPEQTQPVPAVEAVRITVSGSGWYGLTPQAVREAGLQWDGFQAVRLWLGDQIIPLWRPLEISSDTALFYVPQASESEKGPRTLLLEPEEDGASPAPFQTLELPAEGAIEQAQITAAVHLEQDIYYDSAAPFESPWLWQQLSPGRGYETSFEISAPIQAGQARIVFSLWGITGSSAVNPDHHFQAVLNGHDFDSQSWDGQGEKAITLDFPAEWLLAEKNTLTLSIPAGEAAVDLVTLDSVDIQFPSAPESCSLPEHFSVDPGRVSLKACASSVWLADSSDPSSVWVLNPAADGSLNFILPAADSFTSGIFSTVNAPDSVVPASLSLPQTPSDELIIAPEAFISTLQPLLDFRRGYGLNVEIAALEAVENVYTHGSPSALAVQRYLQSMANPPKYLLLIGDASYDPAASSSADFFPAPMLRTRLGGWTASDRLYLQPALDSTVPGTAIGRIPARTPAELEVAVKKILAYEQDLPTRITAAALADPADLGFTGDAEHFLSFFPGEDANLLPSDATGIGLLTRPVQVTAYFGHGSLVSWGSSVLLDATQVTGLVSPSPQPIVAQFTCLTGFFIHPTIQSLSETLLFNPAGGASAVFAPSSLSLPSDQSFLAAGLARAFASPEALTLGDALTSAWKNTPAEADAQEAAYTFILFGDPAMRLRK